MEQVIKSRNYTIVHLIFIPKPSKYYKNLVIAIKKEYLIKLIKKVIL